MVTSPKKEIDLSRVKRQGYHLRKDLTDAQKNEIRAMIQAEKEEKEKLKPKVPGRGRGRPKMTEEEKAAAAAIAAARPKLGRPSKLTDEEREARAEARKYVPTGKNSFVSNNLQQINLLGRVASAAQRSVLSPALGTQCVEHQG